MDFLKRHRGKFLWLGGTVTAAYAFGHYAKRRLFELQEQAFRDRVAHDNLQRRFDQNQQDCTFHILSLLPDLADNLFATLDAEQLALSLQLRRSAAAANHDKDEDPQNDPFAHLSKAELWHEIKIVTVTRLLTALYSLSMVATLTRVQLNLVGRRRYLDSVLYDPLSPEDIALHPSPTHPLSAADDDNGTASALPPHIEAAFLTLSYHLVHNGWKQCASRVRVAVESVFGGIPLKKPLSQSDLTALLASVRQRIESTDLTDPASGPFAFQSMLFPSESDQLATLVAGGLSADVARAHLADPRLRALLNETRDVLDAPHTRVAMLAGVARVTDVCLAHHWIKLAYPPLAEVSDTEAAAGTSAGVPLAALLPHAKQLAHVVLNGVPNEYVAVLATTPELNQLAMVVYAQFAGVCVE